jgi:hypothetical protein
MRRRILKDEEKTDSLLQVTPTMNLLTRQLANTANPALSESKGGG